MKKVVCVLIAIIIMLYVAISDTGENTIVIYSALEQYRNDDIKAQLTDIFPDLNIQIMYLPTAKGAAKIQSEKEKSDADIVLGIETRYMEKIIDSLATVTQYSDLEYIDGMNPEHGKYLIWESYGGGFAVNTEIWEKYGIEQPTGYDDLLAPEFQNKIVLPDPKSSSTGYNFMIKQMRCRNADRRRRLLSNDRPFLLDAGRRRNFCKRHCGDIRATGRKRVLLGRRSLGEKE